MVMQSLSRVEKNAKDYAKKNVLAKPLIDSLLAHIDELRDRLANMDDQLAEAEDRINQAHDEC